VFFVDDDPLADQEAENTLVDVARAIGFKDVSFQYEPIAAAFDYESTIEKEELVLIVDIGGGTRTSPWCACPRSVAQRQPSRRHPRHRRRAHRRDRLRQTTEPAGPDAAVRLRQPDESGAYMPTSHHMNLATWHTINSVYSQNPPWRWAACATTSKTPAASTACSS
jgi:hypothetical chaperone protein